MRVILPAGPSVVSQAMSNEDTEDMKNVENISDVKRYLMNWAQSLKTQGVKVSYEVTVGTPAKVIMELAQAQQASLNVMMNHGRRWLKRAIRGSVTEEILMSSSVPVLIMRAKKVGK